MSDFDIPDDNNGAWDYYYKIYYEDDENADDFLPPENQNYKFTTPTMAEYDPTTVNEDDNLDWLLDNDDDDDDDGEETNTTQPFTPGAASTPSQPPGAASGPYHGGESHEMTNFNSFAFTTIKSGMGFYRSCISRCRFYQT